MSPRAGYRLVTAHLRHVFEGRTTPVVDIAALVVEPGEIVAITGPSGSGKTTLAYLLTGIEPARAGSIVWGSTELVGLAEAARDAWRRDHVGFVFQDFHLLPGLSIERNVVIGAYFEALRPPAALWARASGLLRRVAVPTDGRRITELSRGEQQRVAVARALVRQPPLLVADEPTASLDPASGALVIELLVMGARELGATLLMVTHDPALLDRAERILRLEAGRLVEPASIGVMHRAG